MVVSGLVDIYVIILVRFNQLLVLLVLQNQPTVVTQNISRRPFTLNTMYHLIGQALHYIKVMEKYTECFGK